MSDETIRVGVVGAGAMGQHHARVYHELSAATLVGVADVDEARARELARKYGTKVRSTEDLLSRVDAVSIVVPTEYHYDVATSAIDRGVDVLVEKPIAPDVETGRRLVDRAESAGVLLQVGHIERFNPAVRTLSAVAEDLDVIGVEARRLGPPVDRGINDSVALDLMIHDLDVVSELVGSDVQRVDATGTADSQYVTATVRFENDVVAALTASRVTHQKVRELAITAENCKVNVDYLDRSVEIRRKSTPEFVPDDGSVRYRNECVIERPTVDNGEPLKFELESFLAAVRERSRPVVDGIDGVRALELAKHIERLSKPEHQKETLAPSEQ